MKFFSRFLLFYALVVIIATLLNFSAQYRFPGNSWISIIYIVVIFMSALGISQKDEHQRYAGFNYHFITYVIVNGLMAAMTIYGIFPKETMQVILNIMLFWGIGLLFHLAMYLFIFRKKAIKSYDKEDVFK